ncbi:MAG: RNA polymerase sigma factor [Flavobacteriaceae bacterium]|nr:RNA polymerase sigma factor [Bacteroidia bacterium]NNK87681.1 RNA polymerase sigma factor [Flavobacteriaceae bacterium]
MVVDYQNGNKKSMVLLVKRWHAKFCHRAYMYTKDIDSAQDIVQDAWQVIINKIEFLDDPNAFKTWANRIVINKSIDWLRKRKREPQRLSARLSERQIQGESTHESKEDILLRTQEAIKGLAEKQQEIIRLFYTEEYNIQDIATILNISPGTVKSRLFYAREHLKQILKHIL